MPAAPDPRTGPAPRGRCRCGHLATDHMIVAPISGSASFRLEATGPCRRCGAAECRRMSTAPDGPDRAAG